MWSVIHKRILASAKNADRGIIFAAFPKEKSGIIPMSKCVPDIPNMEEIPLPISAEMVHGTRAA